MNPRGRALPLHDAATSTEQTGIFSRSKIEYHVACQILFCLFDTALTILFKFAPPTINQVELNQIPQCTYY